METDPTPRVSAKYDGRTRMVAKLWRLWKLRFWRGGQWFCAHCPRGLTTGDGLAFASIVGAIFLTIGQCSSTNRASDIRNRQEFVRMALGTLMREAPEDKDGNATEFEPYTQILREWAIRVLNHNTEEELKIPELAFDPLIKGKIGIDSFSGWYDSGTVYGGYDYSSGYDDWEWDDSGKNYGTYGYGEIKLRRKRTVGDAKSDANFYTYDSLEIRDGKIYINGNPLTQDGKPLKLVPESEEKEVPESPTGDQPTTEAD